MSSPRRHGCSPAAGPLDDDDLLREILLRLPPQPSSLPRASLVCKRWRGLVSDPRFFGRFRLHHRRNPPLLGLFAEDFQQILFVPTMETPNRIPPERFSLQRGNGDRFHLLGCRHGLILVRLLELLQVLVWDPVTGDRHRIAIPAAFDTKYNWINGAVLRVPGDFQHFQVVLAAADGSNEQDIRAFTCIYSSQTGLWGNIISTLIPYQAHGGRVPTTVCAIDALLAGDSLYWRLAGNLVGIMEFDLVKQSLAVIRVPTDMCVKGKRFKMVRAEGGELGLFLVSDSDCTAQLWKWKNNCDGASSWVFVRTIEVDKLLSLKSEEKRPMRIIRFAEENNVVLLWTKIGLFMIHLESLKFKKLFKTSLLTYYHPFESVYTAEIRAGGGHDGAEILLDT